MGLRTLPDFIAVAFHKVSEEVGYGGGGDAIDHRHSGHSSGESKAHELLSDETKWTKGSYAKNSLGNAVNPTSTSAICYCLIGAIGCAYPGAGNARLRFEYKKRVAREAGRDIGADLLKWNDAPERTFQEVKDLLVKLDI